MLLEFSSVNYKSFKDKMTFSLIPKSKQTGLDYSVFEENIGKKAYRGICSAVIYGANASGKTNIIGAMDTFKQIVFRGNIRNYDERKTPNYASNNLELIPNNTSDEEMPVDFNIRFIENGLLVEYGFSIKLGKFLDGAYNRKTINESLKINEEQVFLRSNNILVEINPSGLKGFSNEIVNENFIGAVALASNSLKDDELFLSNGFKTIFSPKLVDVILDWLKYKFVVIYNSDMLHSVRRSKDFKKESIYIEENIDKAARYFGISSNAVGYMVDDEDNSKARLCSVFGDDKKGTALPAELFESYGTIRFINLFPMFANALLNGATLVVDELDTSIHPMALMSIINIFHNDEVNINKAQLVFNTHNPIFLNSNLFRRDEIKFVERDDTTHFSIHYSLSDFKTAGKNSVRKTTDYMKNYFVDRYGAIKDIDFTPIFEEMVLNRGEV